jgi:hypothetical protein
MRGAGRPTDRADFAITTGINPGRFDCEPYIIDLIGKATILELTGHFVISRSSIIKFLSILLVDL